MAQFDVYKNSDPNTKQDAPYLLDVQAGILASLTTRVVMPLRKPSAREAPLPRLNPVLNFKNQSYALQTHEIAAVKKSKLGEPIGNIAERRDAVVAAIDFLVVGF